MLAKLAFVAPLYDVEERAGLKSMGADILKSVAIDYGELHGLKGGEEPEAARAS
jgi:hypothetical protein